MSAVSVSASTQLSQQPLMWAHDTLTLNGQYHHLVISCGKRSKVLKGVNNLTFVEKNLSLSPQLG